MTPSTSTRIAAASAAAGAALLVVLALCPMEWFQPLAAYIRRADDLTPERFGRLRHVCWTGAVVLLAAAVWIRRRSPQNLQFLAEICRKPTVRREGRRPAALATIILLTGGGLRFAEINNAIAYDEAYTYVNFASRPWYEAIGDYNSTNNHLLNTLLVHFSTRIFGPWEWAIRLPVFVWVRDWIGPPAGLVVAALTAISPMLITYSVDARGYMYVALAAVVLDASLARVGEGASARAWATAFAAIVFGLCAMPIMVYSVVASLGWFVLLKREIGVVERLKQAAILLASAAVPVGLFYTPAYIFRGLMFLDDPIMQSEAIEAFPVRLAAGWWDARLRLTEGVVPGWLWLAAAAAGAWSLRRSDGFWLRWTAPFVTVLSLNVVQQVAPPARVYLQLGPWLYMIAGAGMVWALQRIKLLEPRAGPALAVALCLAGCWYSWRRPVLFHPEDRAGYVSMPMIVERLEKETASTESLLLAPLPLDLPAIYYMDRRGFRIAHNQQPSAGQVVWLIARAGETPMQVLADGLIQLSHQAVDFEPWEPVAELETLTLYRSRYAGE